MSLEMASELPLEAVSALKKVAAKEKSSWARVWGRPSAWELVGDWASAWVGWTVLALDSASARASARVLASAKEPR